MARANSSRTARLRSSHRTCVCSHSLLLAQALRPLRLGGLIVRRAEWSEFDHPGLITPVLEFYSSYAQAALPLGPPVC